MKQDDSEIYVRRDMTDADIRRNVKRLRDQAAATLKHADALEQFGRNRKQIEVNNEQK